MSVKAPKRKIYCFESPLKHAIDSKQQLSLNPFKGTRGVQHGVWTPLPSFMIIRESIDITMLRTEEVSLSHTESQKRP